jgi:hypothetical protein
MRLQSGLVYWVWVVAGAGALAYWAAQGARPLPLFAALAAVWLVLALLFGVPPLRRLVITPWLMKLAARALPRMGDTERDEQA